MNDRFDVIVLGGGSAGLAHALRASSHGARVAMLEPNALGGTCVNAGCVPKKAMWVAAQLAVTQRDAHAAGFASSPGPLDWSVFIAHRQAYIDRIHRHYREALSVAGIVVIEEAGRLGDPHRVATRSHRLHGRHIVIATGARPRWPTLPGAELGIDSNGFFDLRAAPRRIVIVGGGYIAVELAGILDSLGVDVHMLVRSQRLLEGFDGQLTEVLTANMRARGICVDFERNVIGVHRSNTGTLRVALETESALEVDCLIWAIGRQPNVEDLGLEDAGVECADSGHINVDEWQDTNSEHIHALGDVTGKLALTPVATASARLLADRLFGGNSTARLDYDNVPTVVFGSQPVGSVGLSEAQARRQYGDAVRIHCSRFTPMLAAMLDKTEQTFMKLVCVGDQERIVGLHMVGQSADEILQGFAVALKLGATRADLAATVAIHPSSAEEFVLMR
ncbi:MAG: glutathione-disulfide reductase [Dokdonella sp.]